MLYDFIVADMPLPPVWAVLGQNRPKWLSINHLRAKPCLPNQAQSRLFKAIQVIFLSRNSHHSLVTPQRNGGGIKPKLQQSSHWQGGIAAPPKNSGQSGRSALPRW